VRWDVGRVRRKKRGKRPSSNARASLAELVETPLRCAPKTFRLPRLCSQEERAPNEKEKMASESSAWGRLRPNARRPPPHRSLRRTTTLPEIVSAFRDRGRIDPHQSHLVHGARFFFFRSRHHERKRPNTTHLFARRIVGPKATGARTSETGGPSPFASLLFFAPQKNAPFFSSSWSSSSSSSAAATLWRVLHAFCVALQMRDFLGGEEVKERRCS
jgi:hypothetical protein